MSKPEERIRRRVKGLAMAMNILCILSLIFAFGGCIWVALTEFTHYDGGIPTISDFEELLAPPATPTPTPTWEELGHAEWEIGPRVPKTPPQIHGWEGEPVKTVCLVVEQTYPQIKGEFSEPIYQATQEILTNMGLGVVAPGTSCDATLTIKLEGVALGANYVTDHFSFWKVPTYCYTGAEVEGQIRLTSETAVLTFDIEGISLPGQYTSLDYCPEDPESAPFVLAWSGAVFDGVTQLWGDRALAAALEGRMEALAFSELFRRLEDSEPIAAREIVPALVYLLSLDDSHGSCTQAIHALAQIGPEAIDAVPALIHSLRKDEWYSSEAAYGALKAITGEDFGNDPHLWQEWWETQK